MNFIQKALTKLGIMKLVGWLYKKTKGFKTYAGLVLVILGYVLSACSPSEAYCQVMQIIFDILNAMAGVSVAADEIKNAGWFIAVIGLLDKEPVKRIIKALFGFFREKENEKKKASG